MNVEKSNKLSFDLFTIRIESKVFFICPTLYLVVVCRFYDLSFPDKRALFAVQSCSTSQSHIVDTSSKIMLEMPSET